MRQVDLRVFTEEELLRCFLFGDMYIFFVTSRFKLTKLVKKTVAYVEIYYIP